MPMATMAFQLDAAPARAKLSAYPIQRFAKQCDQIVLRGRGGDLNDEMWVSEEERVLPGALLLTGIKALGSPVGTADHCRAFYVAKAAKTGKLCSALVRLAGYAGSGALLGESCCQPYSTTFATCPESIPTRLPWPRVKLTR